MGDVGEPKQRWYQGLTRYHWWVLVVGVMSWMFDCMDQRLFVLSRAPAVKDLLDYDEFKQEVLAGVQQEASSEIDAEVADGTLAASGSQAALDARVEAKLEAAFKNKAADFGNIVTALMVIGWSVGGFAFGIYGDRLGRVKTLAIAIFVYSIFTGLSGLSVGLFDFCLYRFLMGCGIGGALATAATLIAETMPDHARATALRLFQSLSALGNIGGSCIAWFVVSPDLPTDLFGLLGTAVADRRRQTLDIWNRRAPVMSRHRSATVPIRTLNLLAFAVTICWCPLSISSQEPATSPPPNFVVIVCDNLGYGDVGCFGSVLHRTPQIDRMAAEGVRFTDFYVTSGVCTPSRASIMTGCYPRRVNMHVDENGGQVLRPVARKGLHPDEITIAEVLKSRGYATAMIGKWHLGDQPPFLPTRQGFDYYFGIPYSDDMTARSSRPEWPPLPLMENQRVIEAPPDRNLLTKRYTESAIQFCEANRDRPFFLYLPQAMPGSTRAPFASAAFRGQSANGPWGDSVEELDWSTGQILAALKRLGLDERTLVIWTSDNGAPRRNPPQGSNLPLAGWGYTTAEGGMRVPCVMRWPGKIPAGITCRAVCTTMDWLPTLAQLAGATVPADRILDGHDIWPLMSGQPDAKSPHEAFYYYYLSQLQAVRSGRWKLYLPLDNKWRSFRGDSEPSPARLYDLVADLGETQNVVDQHPEVVARLTALADKARRDLGDLDRPGAHQRPAGFVDKATPRVAEP